MTQDKHNRIKELVERIPSLTDGQLYWINRVINVFQSPHDYHILKSDLFDERTLDNFGDALRIHHGFSAEPFSKDKFEYVLETVLKMTGHQAQLAPRGNRGHDITIDGTKVSLKTQADKNIQEDKIWISKFMELGRGTWGDDPKDLIGLRNSFLRHLQNYDRIFTLRALKRSPQWHYELVEIPKHLMLSAEKGELVMKLDSAQYPKPGYCYIRTDEGENIFQLYFDAGSERKLQVKSLLKSHCVVHASWRFTIPS
jgi:type II restriction enzyme